MELPQTIHMGAQWLSGRVLDSRPKGRGFEPHRRHCVVSLSKNINPSLVLVQPRKTRPFITERLLMGRKESNQTNKTKTNNPYIHNLFVYERKENDLAISIKILSRATSIQYVYGIHRFTVMKCYLPKALTLVKYRIYKVMVQHKKE